MLGGGTGGAPLSILPTDDNGRARIRTALPFLPHSPLMGPVGLSHVPPCPARRSADAVGARLLARPNAAAAADDTVVAIAIEAHETTTVYRICMTDKQWLELMFIGWG